MLLKYSSLAEEEIPVYAEEIKFFRSRDEEKPHILAISTIFSIKNITRTLILL